MDDPIREEKTLFEKFKELREKMIRKPPKHENYFVKPYETEEFKQLQEHMWKVNEAVRKTGISAEQFHNGILNFNKILTQNELRKIIK